MEPMNPFRRHGNVTHLNTYMKFRKHLERNGINSILNECDSQISTSREDVLWPNTTLLHCFTFSFFPFCWLWCNSLTVKVIFPETIAQLLLLAEYIKFVLTDTTYTNLLNIQLIVQFQLVLLLVNITLSFEILPDRSISNSSSVTPIVHCLDCRKKSKRWSRTSAPLIYCYFFLHH